MRVHALFGAVAVVVAVIAGPAAEAAEPQPAKSTDECVVHITGQKATGELILSAERCYATHAEAMEEENVAHWGPDAAAAAEMSALTFTIGYHCDGYNLTSSCLSVVGDSCIGGWIDLTGAYAWWNNRISSTLNGCPTLRHYDGVGPSGASVPTYGVGSTHNLTSFNNRTSSIRYS